MFVSNIEIIKKEEMRNDQSSSDMIFNECKTLRNCRYILNNLFG